MCNDTGITLEINGRIYFMQIKEIILTQEDCESILQDLDDMESLTFLFEQEELSSAIRSPDAPKILSLRR